MCRCVSIITSIYYLYNWLFPSIIDYTYTCNICVVCVRPKSLSHTKCSYVSVPLVNELLHIIFLFARFVSLKFNDHTSTQARTHKYNHSLIQHKARKKNRIRKTSANKKKRKKINNVQYI